ncbi:MAG: hypothetical protein MUE33_12475 [Cytophagaceae bacterium]|jgi:hypothetical protein|nr:hypothetical protein [Cytophagaceae bacterium]
MLDKTAFKIQTFIEADNQYSYWLSKTYKERLLAANELILVAFQLKDTGFPKMEKEGYVIKKRNG